MLSYLLNILIVSDPCLYLFKENFFCKFVDFMCKNVTLSQLIVILYTFY